MRINGVGIDFLLGFFETLFSTSQSTKKAFVPYIQLPEYVSLLRPELYAMRHYGQASFRGSLRHICKVGIRRLQSRFWILRSRVHSPSAAHLTCVPLLERSRHTQGISVVLFLHEREFPPSEHKRRPLTFSGDDRKVLPSTSTSTLISRIMAGAPKRMIMWYT